MKKAFSVLLVLSVFVVLLVGCGNDAVEITWADSLEDIETDEELKVGDTIKVKLPADGTAWSVWGTGTYSSDSSVGTAAVHAGAITLDKGGVVEIEVVAGQDSYEGSSANGVDSADWGSWELSFKVVD